MMPTQAIPAFTVAGGLLAALSFAVTPAQRAPGSTAAVSAKLSEWKVELSEGGVAAGPVTFTVANGGSIPHAFEVEGQGVEKQTAIIQPGASAALTLTLKPGTYEVYCPVGQDSHKMLGMLTHLVVGAKPSAGDASTGAFYTTAVSSASAPGTKVQSIEVTSGGRY
jgi:plastocyanin